MASSALLSPRPSLAYGGSLGQGWASGCVPWAGSVPRRQEPEGRCPLRLCQTCTERPGEGEGGRLGAPQGALRPGASKVRWGGSLVIPPPPRCPQALCVGLAGLSGAGGSWWEGRDPCSILSLGVQFPVPELLLSEGSKPGKVLQVLEVVLPPPQGTPTLSVFLEAAWMKGRPAGSSTCPRMFLAI